MKTNSPDSMTDIELCALALSIWGNCSIGNKAENFGEFMAYVDSRLGNATPDFLMSYSDDFINNHGRLAIDDPRLTRAVTDYLSLALINASSIVIDGFMNSHGFNIPGFDGMRADNLICMAKESANKDK